MWATPTEVELSLTHSGLTGQTEISWTTPTDAGGAMTVVYDTLRSTDPADFQSAAICLESDDLDRTALDAETPTPGATFYFLVRAENDCPGRGTLGFDSTGAERVGRNCP